jgi:hypothetical protein
VPIEPEPVRPLEVSPCQSICRWSATGVGWPVAAQRDLRVFRCSGCGSEWVRTEAWTPVDAEGQVPPDIASERIR